jgi:hypothetical protein
VVVSKILHAQIRFLAFAIDRKQPNFRNFYFVHFHDYFEYRRVLIQHTRAYSQRYSLSSLLELCDGGDVEEFVTNLLHTISKLSYVDERDFLVALGLGWPKAEKMLHVEIAKLLQPDFRVTSS